MNAPTNHSPDNPAGSSTDQKIKSMLRQLDDAGPPPPSFDDLGASAVPNNESARPNWINLGAAASIVALGVGGLVLLSNRDTAPVAEQPRLSTPGPADSLPHGEPSVGTEPVDADPTGPEPEAIGLGEPLIGAALSADASPLFEVDRPNWIKEYVNGTEELPYGDRATNGDTNMVVLVGDGGPTYDQPLINVTLFDIDDEDINDYGDPIQVGDLAGAVNAFERDVDTQLVGPTVNLTVDLGDGRALRVSTVRLGIDETVAIAQRVEVGSDRIELDAPGFRQLPFDAPAGVRNLSYRWVFDDGTAVPEPVVISTPTATETIDQQPSIEIVGENLGPVSLMGRIGLDVRENRVINGLDIAYRPLPDQPGSYWADWLDGGWSFYAIGSNLESEEQFISLLGSLTIVDEETFAAGDPGIDVTLPGRHDEIATDILGDLGLSTEQFDQASTTTMITGAYDYAFELYFGLGCVAKERWVTADAAGDDADRAAAVALVEAAAARPDDDNRLPSNVGLAELATAMRAGDRGEVAPWGSNDCPLWTN